jgi:hypothetical protein
MNDAGRWKRIISASSVRMLGSFPDVSRSRTLLAWSVHAGMMWDELWWRARCWACISMYSITVWGPTSHRARDRYHRMGRIYGIYPNVELYTMLSSLPRGSFAEILIAIPWHWKFYFSLCDNYRFQGWGILVLGCHMNVLKQNLNCCRIETYYICLTALSITMERSKIWLRLPPILHKSNGKLLTNLFQAWSTNDLLKSYARCNVFLFLIEGCILLANCLF